MKKTPSLFISLIPVIFLIIFLTINVQSVFGEDALLGPNQLILILSGGVAAALGVLYGVPLGKIVDGIGHNIKDTIKAILIIFLIGGLAGTWMISGVIPAMVYYGLQILSPTYFLAASLVICSVVSLATGSSWGTTATMGIALMGIGETLGMNPAIVAGAVISGAYFGDKLSPMSDTTNLAAAMTGTDLFVHIRYMMLTTIPSILIALIIFFFIGMGYDGNIGDEAAEVSFALKEQFNITPWLLLVPLTVIGLILAKVDALVALLVGVLIGGPFAFLFQPDVIDILGEGRSGLSKSYYVIVSAIVSETTIESSNPVLAGLLTAKGMGGMLETVWLVVGAMVFGGAMEATGFLKVIAKSIISLASSTASLVASTLVTTGLINIAAADQFLAIVVPGRMFKEVYRERGLASENLSRTVEDGGTVTSVLIPWNTCGAYQSATLGIATGEYWVYCFFNIISPFMSLIYAIFGIKIKTLEKE